MDILILKSKPNKGGIVCLYRSMHKRGNHDVITMSNRKLKKLIKKDIKFSISKIQIPVSKKSINNLFKKIYNSIREGIYKFKIY